MPAQGGHNDGKSSAAIASELLARPGWPRWNGIVDRWSIPHREA
jgi:hypothetical protein